MTSVSERLCACGCGERLIPKRRGRGRIETQYLPLHRQRMKRLPYPDKPVYPCGTCECGCGQKTGIATRTDLSRGVYAGHPSRFRRGHQIVFREFARTDDYVEEDRGYVTPCWIWRGGFFRTGYGRIAVGQRKARVAHRVYYERFKGAVPDGMMLDHLCEVKSCVNPGHLEAVSAAENTRRGGVTRFTVDDIAAIRTSTLDAGELAARYSTSVKYIQDLRRGKGWKDVV
jgi:hypothetical protein